MEIQEVMGAEESARHCLVGSEKRHVRASRFMLPLAIEPLVTRCFRLVNAGNISQKTGRDFATKTVVEAMTIVPGTTDRCHGEWN